MSVNPNCATNKEFNLINFKVFCLYMKFTFCLLVLINKSKDNAMHVSDLVLCLDMNVVLCNLRQTVYSILSYSMGRTT